MTSWNSLAPELAFEEERPLAARWPTINKHTEVNITALLFLSCTTLQRTAGPRPGGQRGSKHPLLFSCLTSRRNARMFFENLCRTFLPVGDILSPEPASCHRFLLPAVSGGRKEDKMCAYQKAVMDCVQLEVDAVHTAGMEHFGRFSQCCRRLISLLRAGSLLRNLIVALLPYCASCILWTEICGVSRFHPYLCPPTDPQPVIIRTCCSAVTAGNLTPECIPCVIIQHTVVLCNHGRDFSLLLGKL